MHILGDPAFANREWNPYNAALYEAMQARGCKVEEYDLKRLLQVGCDILHLHWPDNVLNQPSATRAARWLFYVHRRMDLVHARGGKVAWTAHNLMSHDERHPRLEAWHWRNYISRIDGSLHLTEAGRQRAFAMRPKLTERPSWVIPHGHYRGLYPNDVSSEDARGDLGAGPVFGFFGQIRPYKGVPALVDAFRGLDDADARLVVAGRAEAAEAAEIQAKADERCRLHLDLIPTEDVQRYVKACDLMVLPYEEIYFSGSAMLSLSFDRPVLAPALGPLVELQREVGDWVQTYEGHLTSEVLAQAVDRIPKGRPDLSAYEWDTIAKQTMAAFEELHA